MNDSEECVEDVNAQLDKLCARSALAVLSLQPRGDVFRPCAHALRLSALPVRGYNIGMRLVDEYFAKTGAVRAAQHWLRWQHARAR
jgi:hypothetical protein